jgi:cell division protein FtsL
MFAKLFSALVLAVLIGSAVFTLRQQRLELMHEITSLHRQMNRDRQATWDSQVRIADHTTPKALRDAITRTGLDMEPTAVHADSNNHTDDTFTEARYEAP